MTTNKHAVMTPYELGFVSKCAEYGIDGCTILKKAKIESPEDLNDLYAKLKYRILNSETNRPFFDTNRDTFEKWRLLSPEQIEKHKTGICWDTASV